MELNRNQYFMAGLVIFLLGMQLRMVDTYVLNERATQFIAQRMQQMKSRQMASTATSGRSLPIRRCANTACTRRSGSAGRSSRSGVS